MQRSKSYAGKQQKNRRRRPRPSWKPLRLRAYLSRFGIRHKGKLGFLEFITKKMQSCRSTAECRSAMSHVTGRRALCHGASHCVPFRTF
jgi:hypothetical protein